MQIWVAGLGRVDCAAICYRDSGYFIMHDDCMSTRCLSFILYFSDPDRPWDPEDGGELELYQLP